MRKLHSNLPLPPGGPNETSAIYMYRCNHELMNVVLCLVMQVRFLCAAAARLRAHGLARQDREEHHH